MTNKKMAQEPDIAQIFTDPCSAGKVIWIGLRPGKDLQVRVVDTAEALPGDGLIGDRFRGSAKSARQVTFIQAEHLRSVAAIMKMEKVDPGTVRRNIVVEGINLLAPQNKRFKIGKAIFEVSGICHPCSKMDDALGPGGYDAMRGRGGITARVMQAGVIHVGASVESLSEGASTC